METITTQGVAMPRLGFGTFRMPGAVAQSVVENALALRLRHVSAGGGHGDDRAIAGAQEILGGTNEQKGAGQVGGDDAGPFGQGELPDRLADHDASVADQRVETACALAHLVHRGENGAFVGDICNDGMSGGSEFARLNVERGGVAVHEEGPPAIMMEALRDGGADAVRSAGDERGAGMRV